ncbi:MULTISPECIES: LLM class flavin-dependent oxidoreductase [Actinosynnema]|uniref:LLM class flavin-dependent oxidoreductase n=1 Tax=Actinosynnema TaxID=40566 RepID=UPI0020A50949|nr:LLM class flavin-dependent oxidoreductase [Actinosynnema pretiosum]MCP2094565.1 Flavin-dependent oxidoreductase, luciferase family (includes alkanesulfonate monooxygenase SsuD and methylene tetrahydromethanopterin reductase) [Actinosynnema pretiosum]
MLLSVLDQSPVPEGSSGAEALRASLELAREVDALGYHRYWVAEHHGSAAFAGRAPEVLAGAALAVTERVRVGSGGVLAGAALAVTERVRVGSGGVLLPRYPAAKVAEVFGVLAALHPGRVDLGVGRAGGPSPDFPGKVAELLAALGPGGSGSGVPLWLLGSSPGSAELAVRLGVSYCFAHFLVPDLAEAALARYRASRRAGVLAVRAVVAESEERAEELALGFLLWRARRDLGHDEPLPSPERVRRWRWTSAELDRARANRPGLLSGTPEAVAAALDGLAGGLGVREVVVNTLTHDPADRLRSYRLLARALTGAGVG